VTKKDYKAALGMYLMTWTIFTGYMFIASLRMSVALILVFGFLLATFACLTAAEFTQDPNSSESVQKAGGWLGIITAWLAWYASAAVVINGSFGAQLFPIGVLGPLSHTTPGLPAGIKRRLTESKLHEDEPIAARDEKDA
jgi:succinate-acetate transporter protein